MMSIKVQSGSVLWIAILWLLILAAGQGVVAEQAPIFPKTYEISEEDAERYQMILERAIENTTWTRLRTIEQKAALWIENYSDCENYDGIVDGLPSDDVITEEHAVFLVYAALEEKYGFDENILCFFHPDMTYDIMVEDMPVWRIDLLPYDLEEYSNYLIVIEAKTGIVLHCIGPDNALG
jgi:hypothetical protein